MKGFDFAEFGIWYIVFLFSTVAHEAAHGLAAHLGGDSTAYNEGQVTLDPIGHIKRSVHSGAEIPFESALTLERELQSLLFQSQDAKEGIAAYVEKRKANFQGR